MSKALNRPEKQGCTPTSSKCVIWDGPDIPCIDLCNGDSVEEVVYKLAQELCNITTNVLDITKLDVSCLDPVPTTWTQMIQTLIDISCSDGIKSFAPMSVMSVTPGGDIILPTELQYTNEEGDLITALPPNDYSAYLAEKIVEILDDIASLQSSFAVMNSRMGVIESTLATVIETQESQNPVPTILSQCASNTAPGIQTPIDTAFENFETTYCNLVSVLGSNPEMTNAISSQPSTLNDAFQIANPDMKMSAISGWVSNPTKISHALSNLWLTINDMRQSVADYVTISSATPCILAMPETLVIDSYDSTKAVVTWSKSNLTGIKDPTGYSMEVYLSQNGEPVGSLIYSQSFDANTTSANITSGSITADTEYVVKLKAAYECGFSDFKTTVGIMKGVNYLYEIRISDDIIDNISLDCYATPGDPLSATTPFDYTTKRTTVALYNIATGLEITNGFAEAVGVVIKYQNSICGVVADQEVVISIPVGDSVGVYEYISNNMINCGGETGCTLATKVLTCGVSISNAFVQFDNITITDCP